MEKDVKEKEKVVEGKKKVVEEKKAAANTAQLKLNEANDSKKEQIKKTLSETKEQVKTAEENLNAAQERLKKAQEVRDAIKALRDAAFTKATAETSNTGQFSSLVQRNQLSDQAATSVANAVENMVKAVLDKSYTSDVCLSYLISSDKKIKKIKEQGVNAEGINPNVIAAIQSFPSTSDQDNVKNDPIYKQTVEKIQEIEAIKKICKDILKISNSKTN